jgi:hypothetical protein
LRVASGINAFRQPNIYHASVVTNKRFNLRIASGNAVVDFDTH